ncbi:MAG: hypothetical protein HQL50_15480 [Magnetococcales bacterium]|nr:hypothetical protein [Magnetococcales bacterium]
MRSGYFKAAFIGGLVLFSAATTAQAARFDVADLTCKDRGSDEEGILLLYWLDGYLSGRTGDTRYSDQGITRLAMHVERECTRDPNQTVLSIIDRMK